MTRSCCPSAGHISHLGSGYGVLWFSGQVGAAQTVCLVVSAEISPPVFHALGWRQ